MNKIVLGLIVGTVLGAFDGLTAWFTPAVRDQLGGIVIGSSAKGLIAGLMIGFFATRVRNMTKGLIFGFIIGLGLATLLVMAMPPESKYWVEILTPGSIVGLLTGWATQRYGRPREAMA